MAANDDSRLLERSCGVQFIQAGHREFIGLCGHALFVAPLAGHAQPAGRIYRIGYLSPGNPDGSEFAFKMGLSRLGLAIPPSLLVRADEVIQ